MVGLNFFTLEHEAPKYSCVVRIMSWLHFEPVLQQGMSIGSASTTVSRSRPEQSGYDICSLPKAVAIKEKQEDVAQNSGRRTLTPCIGLRTVHGT